LNALLVIGAGPAGLMAAAEASRRGLKTILLERNEKPARKLMITGKGRCNLTNNVTGVEQLVANVPVNGKFLYGAFSRFMPADTIAFFESRGVKLKTERGNRVFPVSDKASDVVDALRKAAAGAQMVQGRAAGLLIENAEVKGAVTEAGERISANRVIVATGGVSYPATGSTGDGYELARRAGHAIVELKPSLVPLTAHEGFCTDLQGLSLRNIALKVVDTQTGKTVYKDFGEMLFTHFGVSGPVVLSASSHMRDMAKGKYELFVDLKPALTPEMLDARILRDFTENPNKNFINALNLLLPKKLVPVMVRLSGIAPGTKTNGITAKQRSDFAALLKAFRITVNGFRPVEEAIVTSGGVKVSEINPKTMESKLVKGLYFAGEVIDADAYTGGFNLQIAFSTGFLAGLSASDQHN